MQIVSTAQSQTIFPELTDFISGLKFEDFDEITLQFSTVKLSEAMVKKVTVVSDRYLVISYGITELTHAVIFDIALERWGKVKISHIDCFEFELDVPAIVDVPKQALAFMAKDGTIYCADFTSVSPETKGVILLCKYQYARSRMLQLHSIDIENIYNSNFFLKVYTTLDGKNGTWSTPYDNSGYMEENKEYLTDVVGVNHSILACGNFKLNTLQLTYSIHGKIR
jgi:hypothetical protein